MVSVAILRIKEGLGALGRAHEWKCMPKVIKDRQNLAFVRSHFRDGTCVLCRWCDIDLGRIAMVSISRRSGCSSLVFSSRKTFWKLTFIGGACSEDLLSVGSTTSGTKPSTSAPKSRVLGCAIAASNVPYGSISRPSTPD